MLALDTQLQRSRCFRTTLPQRRRRVHVRVLVRLVSSRSRIASFHRSRKRLSFKAAGLSSTVVIVAARFGPPSRRAHGLREQQHSGLIRLIRLIKCTPPVRHQPRLSYHDPRYAGSTTEPSSSARPLSLGCPRTLAPSQLAPPAGLPARSTSVSQQQGSATFPLQRTRPLRAQAELTPTHARVSADHAARCGRDAEQPLHRPTLRGCSGQCACVWVRRARMADCMGFPGRHPQVLPLCAD